MPIKIKTIVSKSKCGRKAQVITVDKETKHLRKVYTGDHLWMDKDDNEYTWEAK